MIQDLWRKKPDCTVSVISAWVSHYVTPAVPVSLALEQCSIACRSKCFMVIANMKTIFYLMNNQKRSRLLMQAERMPSTPSRSCREMTEQIIDHYHKLSLHFSLLNAHYN